MSEPAPHPQSNILPMTPVVLSDGQRTLAAILFTDTVDFSALMRQDEDRARRLVSRDLDAMRLTCGRFDGQVLKSTGDGLLMLFSSAVQAVSCALEIQANFRAQNRALPLADRLRHRIGIHLGDVIRQHDDVMGDGVNIAARLQAEGAPGGVCVSSTVYEVVQNRVPFYVVSRKARKLKNVGTVLTYQLSQRDGGNRVLNQAWDWVVFNRRKLIRIALVLLVLAGVFYFTTDIDRSPRDPLRKLAPELNPLGTPIHALPNGISVTDDDDDAADEPPPRLPPRAPAPGLQTATDEDFYIARFNDMKVYDFAAMRAWLDQHDSPAVDEVKLGQITLVLQQLFDWCNTRLSAYSESHPLVVRIDDQDFEVWPGPGATLVWKSHGSSSRLNRDQLPPLLMAMIAAQLLRENGGAGSKETAKLWRGLSYFIACYELKVPKLLKSEVAAGSLHAGG